MIPMDSDISQQIEDILEVLEELLDDSTVPKNVRLKIKETFDALKSNGELSIKVNKALHALDEVSDDSNIQAYTRTQIWNIVSMLEKLV